MGLNLQKAQLQVANRGKKNLKDLAKGLRLDTP